MKEKLPWKKDPHVHAWAFFLLFSLSYHTLGWWYDERKNARERKLLTDDDRRVCLLRCIVSCGWFCRERINTKQSNKKRKFLLERDEKCEWVVWCCGQSVYIEVFLFLLTMIEEVDSTKWNKERWKKKFSVGQTNMVQFIFRVWEYSVIAHIRVLKRMYLVGFEKKEIEEQWTFSIMFKNSFLK